MYLDSLAATAADADKPAYILEPSGTVVTYGELEEDSNRFAHLFRSLGLRADDHVALMVGATPATLKISWAARRAGLVYTVISPLLTVEEIAHIVRDGGSRLVLLGAAHWDKRDALVAALPAEVDVLGIDVPQVDGRPADDDIRPLVSSMPSTRIADESEGRDQIYSSGTTGQPKGIVLHDRGKSGGGDTMVKAFQDLWGLAAGDVHLITGPLHHSAPIRTCMTLIRVGATAIVMERFDPLLALQLIERHRVTMSLWVPTMFIRMLRLDDDQRNMFDLSSHRVAVHAAAPCPPEVKEAMIAWWGPIIFEYYDSTESIELVSITTEEWLAHRGSVGRPKRAIVHILDDEGQELQANQVGTIYFEGGSTFEYFNDPEKTAAAYNSKGWNTVGDLGYVDEDGYLYVTDRKSFMIISGGVNIYPQESENVLSGHPAVLDVAVVGVPDSDMGEQVKAVVVLAPGWAPSESLSAELITYCRERLAHYKCPRSVDFWSTLPRSASGKMVKREVRDRFWPTRAAETGADR